MSNVIGAIEIQMLADLARLKKDMDDAKAIVGTSVRGIQDLAGGAMKALGAIGVGLSVAGLAGWVKGAIDAADATFQIKQKAGLAAEEVAGLQLAFKLGGLGGNEMTASLAKLSKQIADGNSAFDTLGIKTRNAGWFPSRHAGRARRPGREVPGDARRHGQDGARHGVVRKVRRGADPDAQRRSRRPGGDGQGRA